MKKWKTGLLALGLVMVMALGSLAPVQAEEISPYAELTAKTQLFLYFQSNVAKCQVTVSCKSGQTGIFGAVALYDETDHTTVDSWGISSGSAHYNGTKEIPVKSGHKYTLTFNGTVGTAGGDRESVSGSVTKRN